MGLCCYEVIKLATFIKEHQCKSVCMIGKLTIRMEKEYFLELSRQFGIQVDGILSEMDSYDFFHAIGVENVSALDYSPYEGANIVFDLNSDVLPQQYREKFDLVIDGGTLEHVFNQYNALNNINALVVNGGYVYHMLPCAGWVDHGFYSFSPTYFKDVYIDENGWELKSLCLYIRSDGGDINGPVKLSQDCRLFHDPVELNRYILKDVSVKGVMIECYAKKVRASQDKVCPLQGIYEQLYLSLEKPGLLAHIPFDEIVKNVKEEKISVYGCGKDCNSFFNALHRNNLEDLVDIIFDSDINRAGTSFRGVPIKYPTKYKLQSYPNKILITSTKYQSEIMELLLENGVKEDKILTLSSLL